MEKVIFTKVKDVEFENGWIYVGNVRHDCFEYTDYKFLLFKDDDFLIWDDDKGDYVEINHDDEEVISVIKLFEHGKEE